MALAPKLQLRQSQSLVMTPQLMQAIKLLQLSSLDLASYVEGELERNPLLKEAEAEPAVPGDDTGETAAPEAAVMDLVAASKDAALPAVAADLDGDTSNVYDATDAWATASVSQGPGPASRGEGRQFDGDENLLETTVAERGSLQDHLKAQLSLVHCSERERVIARHLVDLLDECGYFREDVGEVADRLGAPEEDVLDALEIVHTLEPTGIGARDLAECLGLQLRELDRLDPAMQSLLDNLDLLARRDLARLRRVCGVDEEDLAEMLAELRRLDPKPGAGFASDLIQTAIADVVVRPNPDGSWHVELNPETMPRVLVDRNYHARVSGGPRSDRDKTYITECLQQANWLVRSLEQRSRTILKVASEIVRQQDAFLSRGVRHLKPLTLRMVAEAVELHESTVSRVTAHKYLATPRGLFEFKYFFTSSIAATEGGEAHSAEAVRDRIRELIAAEAPQNILSDDTIVKMLRDSGVDIARRTVAKYRESLRIPSSVQRRREKQAGL
ncbi:RNA polymerase factor sigma-54 [Lutibaculum baratangense]|uniref:RNA polymerase sigma-54 factor n=1 Tax=Lutibaculum baratangense AMV1 TaxID=631454 RepID=V4RII9_9HYPH|nr:RNA polymerase factor sigma-54 [Lutibaculum baratangense]ESR25901.1 RNA polymerase sigma-54 factor RpoN [Lutibaculum baratangense AMV1]